MKLFIYFFICYGLANFFSYFHIAKPIRDFFYKKSTILFELINCIYCCSFWCAVIISCLVFSPSLSIFGLSYIWFIIDGFFVFGLTNFIFIIQNYIEKKVENYE